MDEKDVVQLTKEVLDSLATIGYEKNNIISTEQLIFPLKNQAKGTKVIDRISEQELRQLFIDKFKKNHPELYYSIETPTHLKYKFGKIFDKFEYNENGKSALHDMCVFSNSLHEYCRIFNLEFKSKNPNVNGIGKDILKLVSEKQNGAFIHLLKNTNKNTLCNNIQTGIFDKFFKSFCDFQKCWSGDESKYILIVILSLEQNTRRTKAPILMHQKIKKCDLQRLEEIFKYCNLQNAKDKGWNIQMI